MIITNEPHKKLQVINNCESFCLFIEKLYF